MRRTLVLCALLAGATTSVQAQRAWQTEFGVQGGFSRVVAAGTRAGPLDAFSLPGLNLGPLNQAASGLYFIAPWTPKLAIETDLAASQITTGISLTLITLGLRADYALTDHFYGAAGGVLSYNNGFGANETQLGLQGALGYHRRLAGPLNGRLEVRTAFFHKAKNVGPTDVYSVLIGASAATGQARASRSTSSAAPTAEHGAWSPVLGVGAGYANVHIVGGPVLSVLALPGYGAGLGSLLTAEITMPPTLFAIIPIANRIAVEPGLDMHRFQTGGLTGFTANISGRFDYAVHAGWYGALGGNFQYIKSTGVKPGTRTGLNAGWGYRFDLSGPMGGRVEINYTVFDRNRSLALSPANTFGLLFGATMPLK